MSVVIIGGHDRMVSQYKKICKNYNCKAKVFTQMSASLDKQETDFVRCHTSSGSALSEILMQHVPA